jgi:hypothetical protein
MARKVFQNADLLREIYGYGDPDHRDCMWRVNRQYKEVLLSGVVISYPYCREDEQKIEYMTMKETLTLFFKLRRCKCCTRHCHNKPMIYFGYTPGCRDEDVWLVLDNRTDIVPECKNMGDCECDCRHLMRILSKLIGKRSHMNTVKYETP